MRNYTSAEERRLGGIFLIFFYFHFISLVFFTYGIKNKEIFIFNIGMFGVILFPLLMGVNFKKLGALEKELDLADELENSELEEDLKTMRLD